MDIKSLIQKGEGENLDFKLRIDDQKKIARTLVAFANTTGGTLLIGVKDNGKIAGINPDEEYHMIEGAASLYCSPEIEFKSAVILEGHKLVLQIDVDAQAGLYAMAPDEQGKLKVYIRWKDQTMLANKIMLLVRKFNLKGISKPQVFGEKEQAFLTNFEANKTYTLSKLYKMIQLKKSEVDYLLALFVYWEVIVQEIREDGFFYRVS